jgi:hypothetical protein
MVRLIGSAAGSRNNLLRQRPPNSYDAPPRSYERLASSRRAVVLDGYFQHPEYGATATEGLAAALAQRVSSQLRSADTIGIHLRRGDYVTLGHQLSIEFYETAVDLIDPQRRCSVLVSSDDRMANAYLCDRLRALGWRGRQVQGPGEPHEDLLSLSPAASIT